MEVLPSRNESDDQEPFNLKDAEMRLRILRVLEGEPTEEEIALARRAIDAKIPEPENYGDFDDAA